jgi:hypothetical protein
MTKFSLKMPIRSLSSPLLLSLDTIKDLDGLSSKLERYHTPNKQIIFIYLDSSNFNKTILIRKS